MHGGGPSGEYSTCKMFANIFITFVGAGILGLPFAFKEAGIIEGSIIMASVSAVCIKAMLLLVDSKNEVIRRRREYQQEAGLLRKGGGGGGDGQVDTDIDFGDLAQRTYGNTGWWTVQASIVLSQIGFCCAYLIFITQNLQSLIGGLSANTYLLGIMVPQLALAIIRDLKGLSIFSLMADAANVFAYCVVFFFDFEHIEKVGSHAKAIKLSGLAFFFGVVVYCFEGAGMVLALEMSVPTERRHEFPRVFASALALITTLYIAFGVSGYASFGENTEKIITLNMPPGIFPALIKGCLCFSLYFTYPVMMFPVSTILEKQLSKTRSVTYFKGNVLRWGLVVISGLVVLAVPDFANIMGLIGSTCCMLLALIMQTFKQQLGHLTSSDVFTLFMFTSAHERT
ncbi:hypothetical protein PTSG_07915 [Salpingoeca rosetta]|uniref:Amino acid transporter transmembrane domain-containing protein n=1 Tax=Salpingoeca rosetta (strain ATCC 50818 / BSB-021) TaxID=946362 RepID=F2UGP6_SALR5|nr:uncharacterized protein PTSG_07915 [Salpingoeca rosetta]EGD75796.1 hypothetical protein PTSG_07915 [Salpingoeca rosetta]|eukprot:XP_004991717.1 hypothetical protein PTSG_07915 [Salpingoeca rosetta]